MNKPPVIDMNQVEQAVDALEFAVELLDRSIESPQYWRWVALVLHQATQGFMVCALTGSDGAKPLNGKKKDVMEYIRNGEYPTKFPRNALDTFLGLYQKVKNPEMMRQYVTSQAFMAPKEFDEQMKALNELRNEFQHFTLKRWLVRVDLLLIEPARAALELIDFLAFQSHNILWQAYPGKKGLVRRTLQNGKALLSRMEKQWVSSSS